MRRAALALLLFPIGAWAYWAENHVDMNLQIFREGTPWGDAGFKRSGVPIIKVEDYLQRALYLANAVKLGPHTPGGKVADDGVKLRGVEFKFTSVRGSDVPLDAPSGSRSIAQWVALAGAWEDGFRNFKEAAAWGGRRAVNHFHDPVNGSGGYTGLTDINVATGLPFADLLRPGISVTQWVQNGVSGGPLGKNEWGYPTIGDAFHRAFSEPTLEKRERGLAGVFRCIGQLMHLVGDNTIPDHARDLPHPGDGWEEFMAASGKVDQFGGFPKTKWVEFPLKVIEADSMRAIWDRDLYSQAPEATLASTTPGLDEFTNANFLAWNRYKGTVSFTTIPSNPGEGFRRLEHPSVDWLFRTRSLPQEVYPWPQLGPLRAQRFYASGGRSLPYEFFAIEDNGSKILNELAWDGWVDPLMARAHGYAQTILSLALPPARAEIIPSRTGDFLQLGVRLWNLSPPGPSAVTWTIEQVSIVAIRPDVGVTFPGDGVIAMPATAQRVGPGDSYETATFVTITQAQQIALNNASHVAVLVKAKIGVTPLVFAVPVPNAYPLVQQETTEDISGPSANNNSGCCTSTTSCSACGENAVIRQSFVQKVNGTIKLIPGELDILGKPADDAVKAAQASDVRIAGVQLLSFPQVNQDLNKPLKVIASKLVMKNTPLRQIDNGYWIRESYAADVKDDPMAFEVTVDLHDYYFGGGATEYINARRAWGTLYLAVWTTAGAMWLQRLVLWPINGTRTAAAISVAETCRVHGFGQGYDRWLTLSADDSGGCWSTATKSSPTSACLGTWNAWSRSIVYADSAAFFVDSSQPLIERQLLNPGFMKPSKLAGVDLGSDPSGLFARFCSPTEFKFPQMSGTSACTGLAVTGLTYATTTLTNGTGPCPAFPAAPGAPRTAEYVRLWKDQDFIFQKILGVKTPATYTLKLY